MKKLGFAAGLLIDAALPPHSAERLCLSGAG